MKTTKKPIEAYSQEKCFFYFLIFSAPVFAMVLQLEGEYHQIFQLLLFVFGWIAWTFIEYIAHRFWMHGEGNRLYDMASKKHKHHHQHPDERKVTGVHRSLLFLFFVIAVWLSIEFDNYFTVFAGFYSGFAGFCFLHYVLHKTWSQHFFKELIEYHIYHHCKYPDRCHGVTVTWWDKLFHTRPPHDAFISERIRRFYFEGHVHETMRKQISNN